MLALFVAFTESYHALCILSHLDGTSKQLTGRVPLLCSQFKEFKCFLVGVVCLIWNIVFRPHGISESANTSLSSASHSLTAVFFTCLEQEPSWRDAAEFTRRL